MRQGLPRDLIVRILGVEPKYSILDLEKKFPVRDSVVTRFAPSPTGYMHLGGLYGALIDYKIAKDNDGVFMLRIEDTDSKREVSDAVKIIIDSMDKFGLKYDNDDRYGPYYQSKRKDVYYAVIADLLARGLAYPCFLTVDDMEKIRDTQKSNGLATGIYGKFAKYRDITVDEIVSRLDAGEVPTIRLYSSGDVSHRIFCKDAIRGSISFPENNEDIVLIKSNDGLPTYHFAHLCDDHFMRTTHVIRGEEWLPSLPLHIQMFNMMGWTVPTYIHTSTIDKIDDNTGKQRKLSKRKDPEANVEYFLHAGWPVEAVLEYLFNIAASGYEESKNKGIVKSIWDYKIKLKKIPISGALFDMKKLEWWSKEFIATLPVSVLVDNIITWANKYGNDMHKMQIADHDYLTAVLGIERDNPKRIRKDFITWNQTLDTIGFFWDSLYVPNTDYSYNYDVLNAFLTTFDITDDKDTWWNKIVNIANTYNVKNGDVAMNLRVALSGRTNTPDLYSMITVMDVDKVINRINGILNNIK